MDKKRTERIQKYYETLVDERDILLETSEKLLQNILPHVELLNAHPNDTRLNTESVLQYEMKVLKLFSEINLSLMNFLDHEAGLKPPDVSIARPTQELDDYLKVSVRTQFTVPTDGSSHKLSNNDASNDSYVRKPLDNDLLKIICANLTNGSHQVEVEEAAEDNHETQNLSPTFSGTDSSSVSGPHPLQKMQSFSQEIPEQYKVPPEVLAMKQYLKEFNAKHGFDNKVIDEIRHEFNKSIPSLNYEYETPVRDREVVDEDGGPSSQIVPDGNFTNPIEIYPSQSVFKTVRHSPPELLEPLGPESSSVTLNNNRAALSVIPERLKADLIEFSNSDTDSDKPECSSSNRRKGTTSPSAVDKLRSQKRHDRNDEVRRQALESMPDMGFVRADPPAVIKNDLKTERKLSKVKDRNVSLALYELKKMPVPEVGSACVFCHLESPNEFYVQLVNDTCFLDDVTHKLNTKLKGSSAEFSTKEEAFSNLGKYCLGYILEKRDWFRVCILDWKLGVNTKEVEVQSVDYGFKQTMSYTYLRSMIQDVVDIPIQALKCHLPFLYPPGSTFRHRLTVWPESTVDFMAEIAILDDARLFQINFIAQEGDSLAVDLSPYDEPASGTVGQMLIDVNAAVQIIDEYDGYSEMGEFLEDIDELENADNLNEFLVGYDARDEARICRFTRPDGSCYKNKHCKLEHITLSKDGYTTDKMPVYYRCINDLQLPKDGDIVEVLVTEYVDSCTYLAQILRNPVKDTSDIVMDKELKELLTAMNHSKIASKYEPLKVWPAIGETVIAYHFTKTWMRGVVSDLKKNEMGDVVSIKVYMMDFGDTLDLKLKNLRKMKEEFMRLPAQIIKIYLYNYQHKEGCDSKRARKFFEKHIGYHNFVAYIMSSDEPWRVKLMTAKGCEVGVKLAREGFAENRTRDFHMLDQGDLVVE